MRSLFAKTLLWFLFTTAIAFTGFAITTALTVNNSESRRSPFNMLLRIQVEEGKRAYETGGRSALAAVISRLQSISDAKIVFTDAKGIDLLTGQDRSDLFKDRSRRPPIFPFFAGRRPIIGRPDPTRTYWLFVIDERQRFVYWFLQPQHLWVIGLVILLCYAFAYHLTSPVVRLRQVVDQFGRGDFSARAATNRRDELGQLASSFNDMADRIQTLLAAERRLLLDISHELRSPLARLGVAVELARSGEDRTAMLDRIEKEANRLSELVSELLQVTRVEGDPSLRKTESVDLDELLGDIVYDSLLEAQAKNCSIDLKVPRAVKILGDEELIRRAIENVLRNAIRHAPPQTSVGVNLEISETLARITIRDFGPGVPEDALPRIFDAFYRVDSDRNRGSGGVGLGLAIARRAVELHKGNLVARNANPGLSVVIEFPLTLVAPSQDAPKPIAQQTA